MTTRNPVSVPLRHLVLLAVGAGLALTGCRPPAAELKEAYGSKIESGAQVDHQLLDRTLKQFVNDAGRVDYAGLKAAPKDLDAYVASLAKIDFEALGRDEKLVALINAYNAFTLALILENYPLASINDIPAAKRWKAARWQFGTLTLSLDQIENEYLRPKFKEPRIHFAINCASVGCPPLRSEAYDAKRIEAQLQEQALRMHGNDEWLQFDAEAGTLKLTKLYDWFVGDFEQVAGSAVAYAAKFHPGLAAYLEAGKTPSVSYLDYDWSLNKQ